jgi:hypothetical protein
MELKPSTRDGISLGGLIFTCDSVFNIQSLILP